MINNFNSKGDYRKMEHDFFKNIYIIDDGTLNTVVHVYGKEFRYDRDYHLQFPSTEHFLEDVFQEHRDHVRDTIMMDYMSLTLTQNLKEWCKAENIKYQSADDLLHSEDLTESQKQWVMDYIKIWELINN